MQNNIHYIIHPNKKYILENFFEGPQGPSGIGGPRGLRGDRGMRGSSGPAGPEGPKGDGFSEADMKARTLWCSTDQVNCDAPKGILARFPGNSSIRIGPHSANERKKKGLVIGGKGRNTGESCIHVNGDDLYIDSANADEGDLEPGDTIINSFNKGNTFINPNGNYVLLNDKKGRTGINMNSELPENKLHIRGNEPVTIENINENGGQSGIVFKDRRSNQNWTTGTNEIGYFIYDNNDKKYNLIAKGGTIGINNQDPDNTFSLDVEGNARYRKDLRLTGGTDASVQINMNKFQGDRKNFSAIDRGLELIGGNTGRSKVKFWGNNMDINYGPLDKTLMTFNKNGVEFTGPVKFKDVVTFLGPRNVDRSKPFNYSLNVVEDGLFSGQTNFKKTSHWGPDSGSDKYTKIENNMLKTNNGIRLVSPGSTSFGDIDYDHTKKINNGREIMGNSVSTGAIVVQSNLVVQGNNQGNIKGIEAPAIKSVVLETDQIKTINAINYSDRRLKEDIKIINPRLNMEKLLKMKGYEYKNKITKQKDKGIIAQDIEKIDKNLVDNSGEYKGIKYNNIIPMLIEGIKYQQKEIDELKRKLK